MTMLLIAHADPNTSLDQLIMFVPAIYDLDKVRTLARESGISQPVIRLQTDMRSILVGDLLELVEEYAVFSR